MERDVFVVSTARTPVGNSGARIACTLINEMRRHGPGRDI